jgi:heme exporter protein D
MDLGPHAAFIVLAYAAAVGTIAGLASWVLVDRLRLARALTELERQGMTRRSEQTGEDRQP